MRKKRTKTATILKRTYPFISLRRFFPPACLLLLLICNSSLLGRQAPKPQRHAVIFGTVWGPDDRALPGMEVKIRRAGERKARWDVHSNRRGEFEAAVPAGPGDYVVWAVIKGYKLPNHKHLQSSPEVTVHVENDERVDIGLHLK